MPAPSSTVSYVCLMCLGHIRERVGAGRQSAMSRGICAPCAVAAMRQVLDESLPGSWWAVFYPVERYSQSKAAKLKRRAAKELKRVA